MKKHQENDQKTSNRVKQICQNFLVHSDFGLAHRLQEEEFAVHYDRNRQLSRQTSLGVQTARVVEQEEKRDFISKHLKIIHQKQKSEENDSALALKIQNETKRNFVSPQDTSSDEQLARILQEEEEFLLAMKSRSKNYSDKMI